MTFAAISGNSRRCFSKSAAGAPIDGWRGWHGE
jgi:hypothetical protein